MAKRTNYDFNPYLQKKEPSKIEDLIFRPVEVRLDEVGGDQSKLLKRFTKVVRNEEVLKPYFDRLMYHQTKGQRRRAKKLKGIYESKKKNIQNF